MTYRVQKSDDRYFVSYLGGNLNDLWKVFPGGGGSGSLQGDEAFAGCGRM